jgi:uncharacterized protein (TIGR03067 family)
MQKDLDLLQGSWNVSELQMEGQTISGGMLANARVVITGNRFESTGMGAVYEGTVTLNSSATPRQLDMMFDAGPEKGNTNCGIYELVGDTWKICLATRGKVRPTSFAASAGSGFVFETLTRGAVQAAAMETSLPDTRTSKIPSVVPTEFQGEWQMVSGVMDGLAMEESAVKWVKRVTRGNETTVTAGPQTMMKMEFSVNAYKSPKTIDYVNTAGPNKGKAQQGIYEFTDGVLKICVAAPGEPRPAAFESVRGDHRTFTVWKRE